MTTGICQKLALGNIQKNTRFFIPRILTETGLLACFYIIFTLACDHRLAEVKGGSYLPTFMTMGTIIIGVLALILLLYTNSFLMKQRKHEFGLYSVLGMEKKHICRVLLHESLISSLISIAAGLLGGMLFYKLCSLAICKLLQTEIIAGFYYLTPFTIIASGAVFVGFDVLTFLFNSISIIKMKPIDLLNSDKIGETEPKIKWIILVMGLLALGSGYAISLTTQNPLEALLLFFSAVLLVIIGTYLLFSAGSIFVLKALKHRKSYYYQPGHMTSVSGLLYRMKQNAVGLASIALLSTGVLIMISSTFCLYSRTETIIEKNYPQDFYVPMVFYDQRETFHSIPETVIADAVQESAARLGLNIKDTFSQEFFEVTFNHQPGQLITDQSSLSNEMDLAGLYNITFITEATYVKLGGSPLGLKADQVAVCNNNMDHGFTDTSFTLFNQKYHVTKQLTSFPIVSSLITVNCYGMVVSDEKVYHEIYHLQREAYGTNASELQAQYCVTFEDKALALEQGPAFTNEVKNVLRIYLTSQGYENRDTGTIHSFWDARESLYSMFGTLLFLGILLGTVCLFATVLIIYYKQISEGYEDRNRYQIMQKIGMTEQEVKKSIRSQIMLVFFLPLITAGVHVAFAYPILTKIMAVLLLDSPWLFAQWCLVVYLVFALVYTLIFKLTAKTYYKIVY